MIKQLFKDKTLGKAVFAFLIINITFIGAIFALDDFQFYLSQVIYFLSGLVLGSLLALFLLYVLIIKRRIRLMVLAITLVIAFLFLSLLFLILDLSFILETFFDLNLSSNQEELFIGLIIGGLLAAICYLALVKFHNFTLFLGPILLFLAVENSFDLDGKINLATENFNLIVLLIALISALVYFIYDNQITRPDLKSKYYRAFPIFLGVIVLAAFAFNYFFYSNLRDRQSFVEEVAQEQINNPEITIDGGLPNPNPNEGESADLFDFDGNPLDVSFSIIGFYQAEEPTYLKLDTFKLTREDQGLAVDSFEADCEYYAQFPQSPALDNYPADQEIKVVYEYKNLPYLPTAEQVTRFTDNCYSENKGAFKVNEVSADKTVKLEYQFQEFDHQNPKAILTTEESGPLKFDYVQADAQGERYSEIKDLAERITSGLETDYQKAKALENYLIENYYYTFTPKIADQTYPIDDFLFDTKKGYCTHFAAALALLLDSIDINARVVGGFYANSYDDNLEAFLLLGRNLHAWTEVYFEEYGWVTFDATTYRCDPEDRQCNTFGDYRTGGNSESGQRVAVNIDYQLEGVDPIMGFDDIFNDFSFDPSNLNFDFSDIETSKNEVNNQNQENPKNSQLDLENWIKIFMWLLIGSVVVIILIYLIKKYLDQLQEKQKQKKYFKAESGRKKIRKLDQKLRKHYQKQLKLTPEDLMLSSKEFLLKINQIKGVPKNLVNCYRSINTILYAESYPPELLDQTFTLGKEILKTKLDKRPVRH
jgi:transglutaminase-like putative cysteine protease